MPCPHCGNQSPLFETPDFTDYCRFCCRGTIKPAPPLEITDDMKQDNHVLRVKWDYFTCELCGKTDRKKNNSTRLMCRACRDSATRRLTRLSNPFYTYNDTSAIRHCDFCGREIRAGAKRYKKRNYFTWACASCYREKISTRRKNDKNQIEAINQAKTDCLAAIAKIHTLLHFYLMTRTRYLMRFLK